MTTFDANGRNGTGYLALPVSGAGPGVLVLHAWWGLNDFFQTLCDRLAGEGFVVFAPDMFAGKRAETIEQADTLSQTDLAIVEPIVQGGLQFLRNHPAVRGTALGEIGFSYGAAWAIGLSVQHPQDIAAVVLYYGSYATDFGAAQAAYLGNFAENDQFEPVENVREIENAMRAAGRDVQVYVYPDTQHWFAETDRPEYVPAAAEQAWQRTIAFLREHLAGNKES